MKSILMLSSAMTRADWSRAEKILQDPQTQGYILAYDRFVCSQARALGDKVVLLDEYLPRSEWRNINKLATEWGTIWYRQPGLEETMTWLDVNLASVVQYPWHYTLNAILRLCFIINRLIDEETPDRIEFFFRDWKPTSILPNDRDPLLEIVAKRLAEQLGLKTINHADGAFFANSVRSGYTAAKNKARSLKQELRKLKFRFLHQKITSSSKSDTNSSRRVLFAQSSHSVSETGEALQDENGAQSLWVTLGRQNGSSKIGHVDLEAHIPLKLSSVYQRAVRLLSGQYATIHSSLAESQFFTFCGVDLLPVIEVWINYLLQIEFPQLVLNIEGAEKIIREYKPDAVSADNSSLVIERIFFLIARKHGIMTIELQHGILNNLSFICFPDQYITDYNIFWGKSDRDKQVALGGDPERYVLCGYPRFDSYFEHLSVTKADVHTKKQPLRIGVTCEKLFKFYGPAGVLNSLETAHTEYYRHIMKAAWKMPETIFSFKVRSGYGKHPLLKDLIAEYGIENYKIVETVQFEEWFFSLNALITDFSTMGLEAMIFDIPVVILNLTGWSDPVGFESFDAVDVVKNSDELYQALSANMQNPKKRAKERAEFVRYALADTEGTAAKRTAQIISQLLHERKTMQNQDGQHV